MTKAELIDAVAGKAGVSKKDAEAVVNAFTGVVTEAMAAGDKITLVGFGTFEAVEKPERTALNVRTKERIVVPAHKAPKFKAGKALKDAVK
jgi:DNA-binding protein HU-beta